MHSLTFCSFELEFIRNALDSFASMVPMPLATALSAASLGALHRSSVFRQLNVSKRM